MGKISANFFISLDGVVEAPDQWHFPYFNDQMGEAIGKGSERSEAFLMGRVVYDMWSEYWPQRGDDVPFAPFINRVPKYVVSNTLQDPTWNNTTVISGDVAGELRDLKARTTGDITMSGSTVTVRWLLANGLLDELHLMIHPIVVGHGQRLFEDPNTYPLRLTEHETFDTGVLNVTYVPAE